MLKLTPSFKQLVGPLLPLFEDDSVTEIMINNKDSIFVERQGKLTPVQHSFKSDEEIYKIIEHIFKQLNRPINEYHPYADGRLPDGSRVNAVVPPISVQGPVLTIRKFSNAFLTMKNLVKNGTLSGKIAYFLKYCVEAKINFLISGGTGSGKTTLLNILSTYIPSHERLVTIEDTAELKLSHPNRVALEARLQPTEGCDRVTIRELVRNALRMRPDRIIVGESRGPEILDMFQAMNTGHDGSMTTIHANSPRECLIRIESLLQMSEADLPLQALRRMVMTAVDLIIQIKRMQDGSRKIDKLIELSGMEGDVILSQDLYKYSPSEKGDEQFAVTGLVPQRIIHKFKHRNLKFPAEFFRDDFQIDFEG